MSPLFYQKLSSLVPSSGAHGLLLVPTNVKSDDEFRKAKVEATKLSGCYTIKHVAKKQMAIAKLRSEAEEKARYVEK